MSANYTVSPGEINWYRKILPECTIIFDVGCKNDSPFYDLKQNIDIHLFDPVDYASIYSYGKYNQIALSDKEGDALYYYDYESILKRNPKIQSKRRYKIWQLQRSYSVKTMTLKKYCKKNNISHIDLLKIDTEGNDYNVLLGAGDFLQNVKYIQWEEWDEHLSYGNTFHKDIKKLLTEYNFTYECITLGDMSPRVSGGNIPNWIGKRKK